MFIANPLAEIFEEPLPKSKNGMVTMPTGPGMGLAVDRKKLEKHRVA
jgi:L-alanine-DL-glutamate epimerase-like enolase superfamily enzyme